mgnify:CR=1 FL=1
MPFNVNKTSLEQQMNKRKEQSRWMLAWATGVSLVWGSQSVAQEAAKKPEQTEPCDARGHHADLQHVLSRVAAA